MKCICDHLFWNSAANSHTFAAGRQRRRLLLQRKIGGFTDVRNPPVREFCKWLLLAVLVFSTLDAALFALFAIGMERLGLRCLNSFFEYYLPEFFPGKLTVYVAAFAGLAALVGWILLVRGNHTGTAVIFAASILPALKSFLIFVTSVLALFSAADFGAQALAFAKDLVTFVTAGLPIGLMLFWKGRGY